MNIAILRLCSVHLIFAYFRSNQIRSDQIRKNKFRSDQFRLCLYLKSLYLSLHISKNYNNWILIKYSLKRIKQDPTWLYFFLYIEKNLKDKILLSDQFRSDQIRSEKISSDQIRSEKISSDQISSDQKISGELHIALWYKKTVSK